MSDNLNISQNFIEVLTTTENDNLNISQNFIEVLTTTENDNIVVAQNFIQVLFVAINQLSGSIKANSNLNGNLNIKYKTEKNIIFTTGF